MKDNVKKNTLILSIAQIASKLFGFLFIFTFSKLFGSKGLAIYTYAYVPFSLFADISALGIVPGVSKVVSKLRTEEKNEEVSYFLKRGSLVLLIVGIVSFLLFFFSINLILKFSLPVNYDIEQIAYIKTAAQIISFALIISPLVSFYRGYLQGHLRMLSVGISILMEQLVKTFLFIFLIYKTIGLDNINYIDGAKVALMTGFIATASSLLVLFIAAFKYFKKTTIKYPVIKSIIKICIPFGLTTIFFSLYQAVDSSTLSRGLSVFGVENIDEYYSSYLFEVARIIFIPILFAQSLSASLMPEISTAHTEGDEAKVIKLSKRAINTVLYFIIPITFVFAFFSEEFYNLFYANSTVGGGVLKQQAILIILFSLYKVLLGIVQGIQKVAFIVIATLLSVIAKYIMNILWIPTLGYVGAVYSSVIAISICLVAVLIVLKKYEIKILMFTFKRLIINTLISLVTLSFVLVFKIIFFYKMNSRTEIIYGMIIYGGLYLFIYFIIGKLINLLKVKRESKKEEVMI